MPFKLFENRTLRSKAQPSDTDLLLGFRGVQFRHKSPEYFPSIDWTQMKTGGEVRVTVGVPSSEETYRFRNYEGGHYS